MASGARRGRPPGRGKGGGRGRGATRATQEFLDRPDVRQAGGLEEEPIALILHRQQGEGGDLWVPGPNVGAPPDPQQAGGEGVQQEVEGEGVQDAGTQALPDRLELPSMDDLQSTTVTTLKWCPKAARGEFARELASA